MTPMFLPSHAQYRRMELARKSLRAGDALCTLVLAVSTLATIYLWLKAFTVAWYPETIAVALMWSMVALAATVGVVAFEWALGRGE